MDHKYKCVCGWELTFSCDTSITPPESRKCPKCGAIVERIKNKKEKMEEATSATAENL
jgi:hypothetical protein